MLERKPKEKFSMQSTKPQLPCPIIALSAVCFLLKAVALEGRETHAPLHVLPEETGVPWDRWRSGHTLHSESTEWSRYAPCGLLQFSK